MPQEMIFHRAHFDALPAHLAVEAHEQERVASHVLLEVLELSAVWKESGERHCGGVDVSLRHAAVCEAHVDDVLASTGTA